MIRTPRFLYAEEDLGRDLDNAVYALDASTIGLHYPPFRGHCFAQPNLLSSSRPRSIFKATSQPLSTSPTASYTTSARLFTLHRTGRFFVIRAKSTTKYRRRYSHPGDESGGVRCDRTIALSGIKSVRDYPLPLRRIRYHDVQTSKTFNFLTNNFAIPAQTMANLYRYRRQVELFFKWIKQRLRIEWFFGTSENAVKSQIWIAISVYILVALNLFDNFTGQQ